MQLIWLINNRLTCEPLQCGDFLTWCQTWRKCSLQAEGVKSGSHFCKCNLNDFNVLFYFMCSFA